MAKCKNCPALKDDGISVIEYYAFGPGCPDQDSDTYGGDCHQVNFPDEGVDEEVLAYEMEQARWDAMEEAEGRR